MTRSLMPWRNRLLRPENGIGRVDMENLIDRFFGDEPFWHGHEEFLPSTNLAETAKEYEVTVDLPGMKADDFNIELQDGTLTISGQRKEEKEEKGKTYHRVERRSGEFRRTIVLPKAVDEKSIQAEYKEGVLRVVLPKSAEVRPRQIKVTT